MEALSFLKFWRHTVPISSPPKRLEEEEEDSFFELELNLPNVNDTETVNSVATSKNRVPLFSSPRNLFSGKKVLPFEAPRQSRRPQPRISLFKPSPNFWTFWTPSPEQVELKTEQRGRTILSNSTDYGGEEKNSLLSSKRFLKIVNPFSGRGSEREEVNTSPLSFPTAAAWKLTGKVKSFSSSAAKGCVLSPAREVHSISVQREGIQSAILHCKKSFNCSTTAQAGDTH